MSKTGNKLTDTPIDIILPMSLSTFLSSFTLVALAEIGDKSQFVCMTLAARHRHWPVILGATVAFIALNTLAVLFGASVAALIPERVTAALVAILFGAFGVHFLLSQDDVSNSETIEKAGRSIFFTTLLLIFFAEFGDKTQIAVAGLAITMDALSVWLGATLALVLVSALGAWFGRTMLQRLPLHWLHRLSGMIFILFASLAAWRVFSL